MCYNTDIQGFVFGSSKFVKFWDEIYMLGSCVVKHIKLTIGSVPVSLCFKSYGISLPIQIGEGGVKRDHCPTSQLSQLVA